jgi:hypothetical protein
MDIPISFIWIIILSDAVFKYGDGTEFWGYVGINAEPLCVEALATAFYADIHALDYAVLISSMQTTVLKSPIYGTFLLSFIQHC